MNATKHVCITAANTNHVWHCDTNVTGWEININQQNLKCGETTM